MKKNCSGKNWFATFCWKLCILSLCKKSRQNLHAFLVEQITWVLINKNTLWEYLWNHILNSLDVSQQGILINSIHERPLRFVWRDSKTAFKELLSKDSYVAVHHKNLQPLATEVFKLQNYLAPGILREVFHFKNSACNFCSNANTFLS